jgi:4-hydroxy-tetrahydrodipicolinate reductase
MAPIKVVVHGALGKVGREVVNAVCHDPETKLVGAIDINLKSDFLLLPDSNDRVPLSSDLDNIIKIQKPDVVVDFSLAKAALSAARITLNRKVHFVSGTTGLAR